MAAELLRALQEDGTVSEASWRSRGARLALRVKLADSNSQVAVMLYHDMLLRLAADVDVQLPDPLADTS